MSPLAEQNKYELPIYSREHDAVVWPHITLGRRRLRVSFLNLKRRA